MEIKTLNDVKRLMSDNETDSVEYKATTGQLERGMETLCAFLNGSGGSVLFGITDKGQINGQEVADSTKRNIAEAINRIEPTAEVQIIYIPLPDNEKKIIVLHVEDVRLNRPFCYKGRAYVRVESMTTVMSQATYEKLLLQRDGGKYRWEQFDNKYLTLQDIDDNEILKTVFMDNQRIHGNLFQLLNAAMSFIFKHLSLSGTTDTLERDEQLTIPYKAIREGILNALAHRSYRDAGGSVGISIYDDRVEIENPGTFPHDWNMEKIRSTHESRPQNPLIANVLYKRKVLENWGRGIGLMISECSKAGLPEPEYETLGDNVRLIFRYKTKYRPSTDQAPTKYRPGSDQVHALLKTLGDKELSIRELMEELGLNHRPTFRSNYLHPALSEGLITPIYPERPSHPKQKYRLTEKGKDLLNRQ